MAVKTIESRKEIACTSDDVLYDVRSFLTRCYQSLTHKDSTQNVSFDYADDAQTNVNFVSYADYESMENGECYFTETLHISGGVVTLTDIAEHPDEPYKKTVTTMIVNPDLYSGMKILNTIRQQSNDLSKRQTKLLRLWLKRDGWKPKGID